MCAKDALVTVQKYFVVQRSYDIVYIVYLKKCNPACTLRLLQRHIKVYEW